MSATGGAEQPAAAAEPETSTPEPPRSAASDWWSAYDGRAALDAFEGRASYYADSLAGRSTASGEPYDPAARTAASRTLPFGTVLRVIRPDTGASVIVRVNDRGPFGDRRRVLDLSRSAAEALDMVRRGVIDVRVEVLERP
jgi:rare lipoprotein A